MLRRSSDTQKEKRAAAAHAGWMWKSTGRRRRMRGGRRDTCVWARSLCLHGHGACHDATAYWNGTREEPLSYASCVVWNSLLRSLWRCAVGGRRNNKHTSNERGLWWGKQQQTRREAQRKGQGERRGHWATKLRARTARFAAAMSLSGKTQTPHLPPRIASLGSYRLSSQPGPITMKHHPIMQVEDGSS